MGSVMLWRQEAGANQLNIYQEFIACYGQNTVAILPLLHFEKQ